MATQRCFFLRFRITTIAVHDECYMLRHVPFTKNSQTQAFKTVEFKHDMRLLYNTSAIIIKYYILTLMTEGQIVFKNGDLYQGNIQHNQPNGKGTYRFKNGSTYQGVFKDGNFHGQGKLIDTFNQIKITGDFRQGKPHGRVYIQYSDGSRYEGQVRDGCREGKGILYFNGSSFQSQYKGYFEQDELTGQGEMSFKNGDLYRGSFVKGVLHGNSQIITKDFSFAGNVRHGIIEGQGSIKYASGDSYTGNFQLDQKHGYGTYSYKDGGVYSGGWQRDHRRGKGKIVYASGHQFQGIFDQQNIKGEGQWKQWVIQGRVKQGMVDGSIKMTKPGVQIQTVFQNGKQQGLTKMSIQHKGKTLTYRGQFSKGQEKPYSSCYSNRI